MIKHQLTSMFGEACGVCPMRYECLAATSVTSPLRRYFLKICGHRQKANALMIQGSKNHEIRQAGIATIESMGQKEFLKKLYLGEVIELAEVRLCSPVTGLRGIMDIVKMQYTKDNKLHVEIRELKTGYSPKYILQLMAYGIMFSDRNMLMYYPKKGRKKVKFMPFKIYPQGNFELNLTLHLENLTTKKVLTYKYMINNVVDEGLKGIAMAVMRKASERRKYHKFGIYYLENLPPCPECKQKEDYCSLWEICQKVNYQADRKAKQKYWGTNKMLISSKPHPVRFKKTKLKQ